jgi:SPP1 family predicted phage head-tail adaptor
VRSGLLRHRIEIQQDLGGQDPVTGEPLEAWTTIYTVWAHIVPLSGRELFQAQQVMPEVSLRIETRYLPDMTPKHRLKYRTRLFGVEAIIDIDFRHAELQWLCKELVDAS